MQPCTICCGPPEQTQCSRGVSNKDGGKPAQDAEKKGFVLGSHGFSQRPTKRREGAQDTFEAITGSMGSLW